MARHPLRVPNFRLASVFAVTAFVATGCAITSQLPPRVVPLGLSMLCWCACGVILVRRASRDGIITLLLGPAIAVILWLPWNGGFDDPDYETLAEILSIGFLVGTLIAPMFLNGRP